MNCNICKKPYLLPMLINQEDEIPVRGIEIRNYCLDNLPSIIIICKQCAEDFAIRILTGNINPIKLLSMFKFLKGE